MNIIKIMFTLTLFAISCQQQADEVNPEQIVVDKNAVEKQVGETVDQYYDALKADNNSEMNKLLSEDGLFFGSDPEEIWDKTKVLAALDQFRNDPAMSEFTTLWYDVTKRVTVVADDGKQAVVTDQSKVGFSKLPVRITAIMNKVGNTWKISYFNGAFLVKNEDLEKVDSVFE